MLVRQHDMAHRPPGKPSDVGVDGGGLGQRGTRVDEQRSGAAAHQADCDVAEREPAAVHAAGQRFPAEMHTSNVAATRGLRRAVRRDNVSEIVDMSGLSDICCRL